jgi:hypothetical protein
MLCGMVNERGVWESCEKRNMIRHKKHESYVSLTNDENDVMMVEKGNQ